MKTSLDLPDALAARLRAVAAEQRRSMNATIIVALEQYLADAARAVRIEGLAAEVKHRHADLLDRLAQ